MKQKINIMARSIGMIFLVFVGASIFDVIVSALYLAGYGNAIFIVIFGLGGIFAGVIGYMTAMEKASKSDRVASFGIIAMQIIIGLLFFFPIASIEGGEYKVPFKAFGLMLALSSLIFLGPMKNAAK